MTERLPPVGWADVATKLDLLALGARLDARIEARFEREFSRVLRWTIGAALAMQTVTIGVVTAVVAALAN